MYRMCKTPKQTSFYRVNCPAVVYLYYLTPEQTLHYTGNYILHLIIHWSIHPRIIWRRCVYIYINVYLICCSWAGTGRGVAILASQQPASTRVQRKESYILPFSFHVKHYRQAFELNISWYWNFEFVKK